jgi:hypothetical protein
MINSAAVIHCQQAFIFNEYYTRVTLSEGMVDRLTGTSDRSFLINLPEGRTPQPTCCDRL